MGNAISLIPSEIVVLLTGTAKPKGPIQISLDLIRSSVLWEGQGDNTLALSTPVSGYCRACKQGEKDERDFDYLEHSSGVPLSGRPERH